MEAGQLVNKGEMIDELNELRGNGLLRLEVAEEKTYFTLLQNFQNFLFLPQTEKGFSIFLLSSP